MKVFGGFYAAVISDQVNGSGDGLRVALLAGPFKTWAEANAKLEPAREHALKHFQNWEVSKRNNFCVTFFQGPEVVPGSLNGALWVQPYMEAWQ